MSSSNYIQSGYFLSSETNIDYESSLFIPFSIFKPSLGGHQCDSNCLKIKITTKTPVQFKIEISNSPSVLWPGRGSSMSPKRSSALQHIHSERHLGVILKRQFLRQLGAWDRGPFRSQWPPKEKKGTGNVGRIRNATRSIRRTINFAVVGTRRVRGRVGSHHSLSNDRQRKFKCFPGVKKPSLLHFRAYTLRSGSIKVVCMGSSLGRCVLLWDS